jgi:hypothetical protein
LEVPLNIDLPQLNASRRSFLEQVAAIGTTAMLGESKIATASPWADAMWQKYPVGDDSKITDPETSAPARRNLDVRVSAEKKAQGYGSLGATEAQNAGCAFFPG